MQENLHRAEKGDVGIPPRTGNGRGGREKVQNIGIEEGEEYEAGAGLDYNTTVNFGKSPSSKELDDALAEEDAKDEKEINKVKEELGMKAPEPSPETPRQNRIDHVESELKSTEAEIASLQARSAELEVERDRIVMENIRADVKGAKDFAELYQVLHFADKALVNRKSENPEGIRMLVEDCRQGPGVESLQAVTRFLGIREKAAKLLATESEEKLSNINKSIEKKQAALNAELKKSGPGQKVKLNDELKELQAKCAPLIANLNARLEMLGQFIKISEETDEQKAYTLSGNNVADSRLTSDFGEASAATENQLKPNKVMRPKAGMGGAGKTEAKTPEKKKRGNIFQLLFGNYNKRS